MGIFSWLTGADKKEIEMRAAVQSIASFSPFGGALFFEVGGNRLEVDIGKRLIIINNNIKLTPEEFAVVEITRTEHYGGHSTGSVQTVYLPNGNVGSAFIPGPQAPTGSLNVTKKMKLVRLTEQQRANNTLFRSRKILKEIGEAELESKFECVFTFDLHDELSQRRFDDVDFSSWGKYRKMYSQPSLSDVLSGVMNIILGDWCEEMSDMHDQEKAMATQATLCTQAKLDNDCFHIMQWDVGGVIQSLIAVDRSGKAVVAQDSDIWMGTLKGASAKIIKTPYECGSSTYEKVELEIRVDDPAYRDKYLTERRFMISLFRQKDNYIAIQEAAALREHQKEQLVEWESRINLLANKLAAAA